MPWLDDFGRKADPFQKLNFVVADVNFPPSMLEASGGRVFVMVVVPAFTNGQDGDKPIVATMFFGLVVLISE